VAEATLGQRISIPRSSVIAWATARSELLIMAALMAVALGFRLWGLGDMALHHDESLHATYSWYLYSGDGYQHNPLMHGPFLFHSTALAYLLFGDSDMTARLVPALFGTVLVGMPYLLRKQIGMPAVIIAAVLFMFSPSLLYFSRFIRNDIYIVVWTFAMVICIWRYLDEAKERWLFGLAAVMALSFATKEVTFITVAIFLVFIDLMLAVELGRRRADETRMEVAVRTTLLAPFAWLIAALWPVLPERLRFERTSMPLIADVMVLMGTLSLPQFAAGIQVLPFVGDKGYNVDDETFLRVSTVGTLMVASLYAGLLWRPKTWAIAAAFFYVPFVLLYTTFFFNMDGFFSGIWGSLDYWLAQHDVRRGNQPDYYYALLTPLYEFLPLLVASAGAVWLAVRGDSLRRWLVFWVFGIFVGLSIAGEKMPWLETHIALPLVLITAVTLARALDLVELRGNRWTTAIAGAAVTVVAVLLMLEGTGVARIAGYALAAGLGAWLVASLVMGTRTAAGERTNETVQDRAVEAPPLGRQREGQAKGSLRAALTSAELQVTLSVLAIGAVLIALLSLAGKVDAYFAVWMIALVPVAVVGYFVAGLASGNKAFGRALLVIVVTALFTLTVRASLTLAFKNDDTPVEMLVYTQTSHDIPDLRDRIDALAKRSGLGHNLPIVVDNADSFAWPWAWYLRDYHSVSFVDIGADYQPPAGAVLLINRSNANKIDASQYSQTPYKHRWWFNETYRELSFKDAGNVLLHSSSRSSLIHFFFYRRDPATTTGSIDGVAFFPNDLSAFDTQPGSDQPPHEPIKLADGRILIGNAAAPLGSAVRGELSQPAGLAVDKNGNLWVADSRNNRIQEFDAQGNFVASIGRAGTDPGNFKEPWGVAVDDEGFIYVADTWNHRIQKFSPDLQFVTTWGTPGTDASNPLTLFGPRDIAIAADGTLWVTDTGNQRVLHFTKDGQPLDAGGATTGLTGFSEPVSVSFDKDGNLLIASAWTGDVRRLSTAGQAEGTIPVGWTSQQVTDKPYVTVLTDDRILVTKPETGELVLFDADGRRVGAWQPLPTSKPVGVVAMPDGGFAFSDAGRDRNEVQIVPANLVSGFFK
jgi:predicted membrane-bound mannosyltransferase/DNA-binding beta-propeller fold protein YncE